jgi:predicted phage terminase large subunit-like protein
LIEDAGSGISLLQDLYDQNLPAIGIKAQGDKMLRMSAQIAKIAAGTVHLPRNAPWLDDLRSELLDRRFPMAPTTTRWIRSPKP